MNKILGFLIFSLLISQICNQDIQYDDQQQKELEQLEKEEAQIQGKDNTQSEQINKSNDQQDQNEDTYSEEGEEYMNLFDLIETLKPLFGLRHGDVERDNEGKDIQEEQNNTNNNADTNDRVDEIIKVVEQDPLMLQWDEVMNDFDPEDLLTFDLVPGASEILTETILKPTTIRGAYFIPQYRADQKIDFYIKSANNTVLSSKERVQEGIFKVEIPERGEYKFVFVNKKAKETLTVTFALDVHESHLEHIKAADLDPVAYRIERLQTAMRDNYFYDKMAALQFEGGLQEVQVANNKLLIFSLIEIIGIVSITGWQVYYLKKIMSNQRII